MKNNKENIDKVLRDRLSDRQFDGPPEDFLNDLNKRLDDRERTGFFGPWNWILDILLLILLVIWPFISERSVSYIANNNEPVEVVEKSKNTSDRKQITKEASSVTKNINDKNPNKNEQNADEIKYSETQSEQDQNNQVFENKNKNVENYNSDNNKKSLERKGTVQSLSSEANAKSPQDQNGSNGSSRNVSQENNSTESRNSTKTQLIPEKSKSDDKNESATSKEKDSNSEKSFYSPVLASQFHLVEPKIRKWDFPTLPVQSYDLVENKTAKNKPTTSRLNFEAQIHAGINFGHVVNPSGKNTSELLLNEQSNITSSFTLGGRVSMWLNNSVFTSGIDFIQIDEKNLFEINDIESYDSTYVSNVDTTVTFDSLNQQYDTTYIYYYDSTTVTDTTVNVTPINQQYTWLQIPFQYGYRFNLNKWAIIPRIGGNLAIGINQSPKIYPNEEFEDLQGYPMNTKFLLNLSGSLEIRRSFNKFHAFVRGDYQTGLRPVIEGDYFDRRFGSFKVNIGIGVDL